MRILITYMGLFSKGFTNDEKAMILDCFVWGATDHPNQKIPIENIELRLTGFLVSKCEPKKHDPKFIREIIQILLAGANNTEIGVEDGLFHPKFTIESVELFRQKFNENCDNKQKIESFIDSGIKLLTVGYLALCYGVFYGKKDITSDSKSFGFIKHAITSRDIIRETIGKKKFTTTDYAIKDFQIQSEAFVNLTLFTFFDVLRGAKSKSGQIFPNQFLDICDKHALEMWNKREKVQQLIDEFLTDPDFKHFIDEVRDSPNQL